MAAKRRALWQVAAAQLLLVTVPLYGSLPELSAIASTRSHWAPKPHLRASSSAREEQRQASQRFHPEIASGDSFHAEAIGTIRALTNEDGEVTDRYTLEAFGTLLSHEGDDPNAYLFAGEPLDPNSGFYYNRARWLDPNVGRFASVDPVLGSMHEPVSLHRYVYAAASPAMLSDPSGEDFSALSTAITNAIIGILTSTVIGAVFGAGAGATDAYLRHDDMLEGAKLGGLAGAKFGALYYLKFVRPVLFLVGTGLGVLGVADAIEQQNAPLAAFRGVLTLFGAVSFFRSAPPVTRTGAGRHGTPDTRAELYFYAERAEARGWTIIGGGGKRPEIYLPGQGPGLKGSNWIDLSMTKNGKTVHVNTVDVGGGGRITPREAAAAALIRSKLPPGEHLILVPKHQIFRDVGF